MSVTVEGLSKRFVQGGMPAVHGASFSAETGSITTLLGPSGSGKTTVLRLIAGLEEPDGGSVRIHGEDCTRISAQHRGIGFVFQGYALFSHLSVRDNIAFGPRVQKWPSARIAARVDELLELVQLADLGARMPSQLSGGQRQRVALARALSAQPRLLVLDDSLSSVDAETERVILANLRRVMKGRTAVLISHRVAAIKDADQIIVLDQGKVVARGTHAELIARGGVYSDLYRTQLDTEFEIRDAG
jgi:sulfate transport system ATP-binding protein